MDFDRLQYHIGRIHSLLLEPDVPQGERKMVYVGSTGRTYTITYHIEGTNFEMLSDLGNDTPLSLSTKIDVDT